MAEHVYLKNEFKADEKYHNLMRWLMPGLLESHKSRIKAATFAENKFFFFFFEVRVEPENLAEKGDGRIKSGTLVKL